MAAFVRPLFVAAVCALSTASASAADESRTGTTDDPRTTLIESSLPAVTQGERTLKLTLEQWMEALAVPGLGIAIIDGHRIAWTRSYGVTAAGGKPVAPDTLFQAASIAKPLTAVAVMHQVDNGKFKLDASINDYLRDWSLPTSEVQAGEPVTVRRLLAHTGGITPGGFQGYARTGPVPDIAQVRDGVKPATNPPAAVVSRPGSEMAYSGLGYVLLQRALEDQLQQPFEAILQDTVLRPLRMTDSTFEQSLPAALEARVAQGHLGVGAVVEGGWRVHPELAAAGLWTTPTDLAKFAIAVSDARRGKEGALLSRDTARAMLGLQQDGMSLGFVVREGDPQGYFAHSGGNVGYFAHFEMLGDTGQGIVVMANSEAGQALASLLIASVATVYDWPLPDRRQLTPGRVERLFAQVDLVANPRVKVDVDPAVLARYVGKYELAPGMLFDIGLDGGQLRAKLADQPEFPLFAESQTRFFLEVVDAQISFIADGTGKVTGLVLHQGGRDQPAPRL